jgi:hypothetical protein
MAGGSAKLQRTFGNARVVKESGGRYDAWCNHHVEKIAH